MEGPKRDADDDPVERARQQWAARHGHESSFVVVVSMLRTYAMMMRELERALKPLELTLSRFEVLLLLSFSREERLPIMRLRDLLLIHGSSATYLVDRLVAQGWLERESDPADRRVSLVHLTGSGRDAVQAGVDALQAIGFGAIGGMQEQDRRTLSSLLAAVRGAASPRVGQRD